MRAMRMPQSNCISTTCFRCMSHKHAIEFAFRLRAPFIIESRSGALASDRPFTRIKREENLMISGQPLESEYAPDYQGYISQVSEDEILPVLRSQLDALDVLLGRVTPERETHRYAEGKWSIREIVRHLIDGERVFGYRPFPIARGALS